MKLFSGSGMSSSSYTLIKLSKRGRNVERLSSLPCRGSLPGRFFTIDVCAGHSSWQNPQ
jgi:hypothetical protein